MRRAAAHAARDGVLGPATCARSPPRSSRSRSRRGARSARRPSSRRCCARSSSRSSRRSRCSRRRSTARRRRRLRPARQRLARAAPPARRAAQRPAARHRAAHAPRPLERAARSPAGDASSPSAAAGPCWRSRRSARGKVPGVVHDSSARGRRCSSSRSRSSSSPTGWRRRPSAEREEVERILRELSQLVGARAEELEALVEATGAVDLALACGTALAALARGGRSRSPTGCGCSGARHPLLDERTAVPIDLELGELRVLVVSGPNTGGKTVALKTLGLAALLHQAGLRPPRGRADAAGLRPRARRRRRRAVDRDEPLDVLGAPAQHRRRSSTRRPTARSCCSTSSPPGTDPVEGSALAQALLARLARQARLTLVTTHYPELKEWASATDGVANAATGFDLDTHAPLYRIALGRPGTSHALQIAERLGLDGAVVEDARGARRRPSGCASAELLAEAESAERHAAEALRAMPSASAQASARSAERRPRTRGGARDRDREGARVGRGGAGGARSPRPSASWPRRGPSSGALRKEIRAARRRERERSRSAPAAAGGAERERDRRLGAASERAARTEQALRDVRGRFRSRRRSLRAIRSRRRSSACAGRSRRSRATRPR